ncbi:hypothetical protein OD350_28720 (plasmid) [Clostridium beijerinckii]|uniref:hypothetical protein n=1 Tax=Clostridium beijerinckii TaxID=1520 RepID=UPI0022276AA9|nr:hypothetical protein [Clostridium beijerinckii]UYZ39058.1 hypothetical protein OD350_28720 [Clostridium beijerinckii]
MSYYEMNYIIGIFLFLFDSIITYFRENKLTCKEIEDRELEIERDLEDIDILLDYIQNRQSEFIKKFLRFYVFYSNNIYTKPLLKLIMFQIPAINIVWFLLSNFAPYLKK